MVMSVALWSKVWLMLPFRYPVIFTKYFIRNDTKFCGVFFRHFKFTKTEEIVIVSEISKKTFLILYSILFPEVYSGARTSTDIAITECVSFERLSMLKAESGLVPSQWETSLQSNAVSHCLGANLESALILTMNAFKLTETMKTGCMAKCSDQ